MTQEDKDLLLKDLCVRLPYNVYVCFKTRYRCNAITDVLDGAIYTYIETHLLEDDDENEIDIIKPYLRPMSSMTEEEENEWYGLNIDPLLEALGEQQHTRIEDLMLRAKSQYNPVDWLNAHHFDYRGLIEKGLAIAVTEDNNPYKK